MTEERWKQSLAGVELDLVLAPTRAPVGPMSNPKYVELAKAAKKKLDVGKALTSAESQAIELAVRQLRPLVPVALDATGKLGAELEDAVKPAFPKWGAFIDAVRPSLRTILAVEWNGLGNWQVLGTGFLVSDRLMLTNRHVLRDVTWGSEALAADSVRVNFDSGQIGAKTAKVLSVKKVSDDLDLALLELEPQALGADFKLLALSAAAPKSFDPIAAIGHPVRSQSGPPWVQGLVGNAAGTKRVSPGNVLPSNKADTFHDATTVGGNSGSPILSLADATVVALHYSGEFAYRNSAVPLAGVKAFLA